MTAEFDPSEAESSAQLDWVCPICKTACWEHRGAAKACRPQYVIHYPVGCSMIGGEKVENRVIARMVRVSFADGTTRTVPWVGEPPTSRST